VLGALENIFPPVPADTAIALGAFLAARGAPVSAAGIYAITLLANFATAVPMFLLSGRYGPAFFGSRLGRWLMSEEAQHEVRLAWEKHHWWGLFVSRFLPGYRAVVPPVAAAMGVPARRALPSIMLASALWYGILVLIAYQVGDNWDQVKAALGRLGLVLGLAALAVTFLLVWLWRRRRHRRRHE
jgi:membrane protein DedA with SNARE-associated domain